MEADMAAQQSLADWMAVAHPTLWPALLFAPRVNIRSARTIGFEAMLNWHLPGWGDVPAAVEAKVRRAEGTCPERAIRIEG